MLLLLICEILGLYVNPLSSDVTYSRHKTGNFQQAIQMHLSCKPKTFCEHFNAFLESI